MYIVDSSNNELPGVLGKSTCTSVPLIKEPLEETEETIKNGQSRDTGNICHTENRAKTKK
jgi:hypothetical protein